MTEHITPWTPTLTTPEHQQAYLEAAFEDGDPALIAAALGDIARVRGIREVAAAAGLSREAVYKAFCRTGNPTLGTLTSVMRALGLKLAVASPVPPQIPSP